MNAKSFLPLQYVRGEDDWWLKAQRDAKPRDLSWKTESSNWNWKVRENWTLSQHCWSNSSSHCYVTSLINHLKNRMGTRKKVKRFQCLCINLILHVHEGLLNKNPVQSWVPAIAPASLLLTKPSKKEKNRLNSRVSLVSLGSLDFYSLIL